MKKTLKGLTAASLAAAAFTGLLAGQAKAEMQNTTAFVSPGMDASGTVFNDDTHACKGHNACKGKGGCKTGDNGCKGKNSCKGKGGCATDGSQKH